MRRELVVGIVGLAIAVAYVLRILIPAGMDPSVLAAFGEESGPPTRYARDLVGEVVTRPFLGHDGRFFFAQANDPWLFDPENNAAVLDRPLYRSQRMAYPMLASLFGILAPEGVLWGLVVVNLLAFGIGTWATGSIATRLGASPWLGLAFALNFGVISEVDIDGAGVVALAAAVMAVLALHRGSIRTAAALLALSALSREVMLLFAVGVFYAERRKHRQERWLLLLIPIAAVTAWGFYARSRLVGIRGTGQTQGVFAWPFTGLVEAAGSWWDRPSVGILSMVLLLVLVLFGLRVWQRPLPIEVGAAPFALLALFLSVNVWREPYDLARAIAPVLTAYPFLVLIPQGHPARSTVEHVFD
jgi:hypothetical protein